MRRLLKRKVLLSSSTERLFCKVRYLTITDGIASLSNMFLLDFSPSRTCCLLLIRKLRYIMPHVDWLDYLHGIHPGCNGGIVLAH